MMETQLDWCKKCSDSSSENDDRFWQELEICNMYERIIGTVRLVRWTIIGALQYAASSMSAPLTIAHFV